ncbi:amino acid adenylation domain-containing protein [Streptomyces tendae]|uniref:hybrid non-ribosomal peptide synthetase/type I polyketide synthase n=1 Tax=Streptomyces tendae TaxID=1932 RepID=UPI003675FD74
MNAPDIAVVGMSCRFPGADDVDQYWANLRAGVDSISRFDAAQLRAEGIDPKLLADPRFVAAGGVLPGAESFDAALFGMPPTEAAVSDPQHRVLLECAWTALEQAGHRPRGPRARVGVFVGSGRNTHLERLRRDGSLTGRTDTTALVMSNDTFRLPTLLSYRLDLRGPSVHVQTACSTSLVAVHLAAQSLLAGECDMALSGGVNVHFPQHGGYWYEEGGIVSPDGTCRPFAADAAGTVFGNGAGLVVLRRLDVALESGDQVLAVLRGTAVNNDGAHKAGFTAPGVEGQIDAVREALAVADVDARTIGYVEAHGTATPLGDPVEIAALTAAYRRDTADRGYCAIGSVKGNLGHLDAAAGIAGLIKAVLAVRHGVIPASLNFRAPNPEIAFADSPFKVAAATTDWPAPDGHPRRAAVSSFGLGGTNAHVVLEGPPAPAATTSRRTRHLVTWSGAVPEAAAELGRRLGPALAALPDDAGVLADAAHTLRDGRVSLRHRSFAVLGGPREAVAAVGRAEPADAFTGGDGVAFLLPGQGAQRPGAAAVTYRSEPVFREHLDAGLAACDAGLREEVRAFLLEPGEPEPSTTSCAQVGLFLLETALARLWEHWGVVPTAMLGHSIGEYVAAHLAGVWSLDDAVRLVAARGRLMDTMPAGRMLAVALPETGLLTVLAAHPGVDLASVNSARQCVLAGPAGEVAALAADLETRGVTHRELRTRHAFHSRAVEPLLDAYRDVVTAVPAQEPVLPFVSGVTGERITPRQATDPDYWAEHLRAPVRFMPGLDTLRALNPAVLLEVGPGRTLSALAGHRPDEAPAVASLAAGPDGDDEASLATAVGRLWSAGADVDWDRYTGQETRRRRALPTYPFQRQRFGLSGAAALPPGERTDAARPAEPRETDVTTEDTLLTLRTLRDELRQIFAGLLGVPPEEVHDDLPFTDLGADSLTLLQAGRLIRERYAVTVPFRALMEEHPTVAALGGHLAAVAPQAIPRPAPGTATANPAVPVPSPSSPSSPTAPPSFPVAQDRDHLALVIREQLELMAAQLALLGGVPAGATGTDRPATDISPPPPPPPPPPAHGPRTPDGGSTGAAGATGATGGSGTSRYVPYQPVTPGAPGGLSDEARRHVAALVDRVRDRTAASRAAAEEDRPVLADERRNARFRSLWKDVHYPLMFARAEGARVHDLDGNEYVDLTMGFGALLLGHNPPELLDTLRRSTHDGLGLGWAGRSAGQAARLVRELTGLERVAFVNSGTDAVAVAVRLARAVTGRSRIVMFAGSYHGASDQTLVRRPAAGSPGALPIAPGLLPGAADGTVVLEYGAPESLDYVRDHAGELAAVLVEPVQSRRPGWQPREFLAELSAVTEESGTALILDEVITGFRTHPGGLQARWGIRADICTFGKVAGGGLPLGIVAGSRRFLDAVDGGPWSSGDGSYPSAETTYVAGTFFRHPMQLPTVVSMLEHLKAEGPALQQRLEERARDLVERMNKAFTETGVPITAVGFSSWFVFEFGPDVPLPDLFFLHLVEQGVYVWEGRICYLSTAHTDEDLDRVVRAVTAAATALRDAGLAGAPAPPGAPAPGELPLTQGQSELWALCSLDPAASAAYQPALTLRLRGPLDSGLLGQALGRLTDRHEALRTCFTADGQHQRTVPVATVPLTEERYDPASGEDPAAYLGDWSARRAAQPFEPTAAPLVRADLLRLSADDHVLLITAHHLVCDGASLGVLVRELGELYAAAAEGRPAELAEPASCQEYLRERLAAPDSTGYWLDRHLSTTPLDLPVDRARGPQRRFAAARVTVPLPEQAGEQVRELSRAQGASPSAVLLSCYVALLRTLTGRRRITVGVFADDRYARPAAPLVADAVSMLPLAFDLPEPAALPDLVHEVRGVLADGYEHRHFSLRRVVRRLGLLGDTSRPPLVATTFNLDEARRPAFGPLGTTLASVPPPTVGVELAWNVVEEDGRLRVECDYDSGLLDPPTVRAWIGYYADLLLGRNPGGEGEPAPAALESGARPAPVDELIGAQLAAAPDRVVLSGRSGQLTGRGVDRAAAGVAEALRARGVAPGDLVGVALGRDVHQVATLLGIWRAGAAYLPLDPGFPAKRLRWTAADAGVRWVVTDRRHVEQVRSWGVQALLCEDMPPVAPRPSPPAPADRPAYVIYTSGSTGRPKGIEVPHSSLAAFAAAASAAPGVAGHDVLVSVTTLSFDISLLELVVPLCAGATVVVAPDDAVADGGELARLLDRYQATLMQATPSGWRVLLDSGWTGRAGLRALAGGEALPPALARAVHDRTEEVWNLYGPTECTVWATAHLLDGPPEADTGVPIGRALTGYTARILDHRSRTLPPTAQGELCISGAAVAWGYRGRPGTTADVFRPDPHGGSGSRRYRTGDLVRQDPAGVLHFRGRTDHQVKLRGHRVEPGEVEAAVSTHDAVAACACSVTDGRLTAYLVPRPGIALPPVAELRDHLGERLPEYMVPSLYVPLAELPLTANGKIDRAALPAPDTAALTVSSPYEEPRDETERVLVGIVARVLGRDRVGIHDNFLELGGDSVQAVHVSAAARAAGIEFTPQQLLRRGSVAALGPVAGGVPTPVTGQPVPGAGPVADRTRIAARLGRSRKEAVQR